MTLPLDPETQGEMFPDTLVEPFVRSDELRELGLDVIATFDEFRAIDTAMNEADLGIVWVFETKRFDPDTEEYKPHTIAKVTKASPLWRCLAGTPIVIQFRQTFWDAFDDKKRRAVIHHELTHIDVAEPDDQGRAKISLRPHDVEDFALTMRRFGPIIPGRATFVKAFLDWQHEQEKPEPTKLRTVEDLAHDLVDAMPGTEEAKASDHASIEAAASSPGVQRAVKRFRDNVEAGTTDVTVSAGGRSATIKGKGGKAKGEPAPAWVPKVGDPLVVDGNKLRIKTLLDTTLHAKAAFGDARWSGAIAELAWDDVAGVWRLGADA